MKVDQALNAREAATTGTDLGNEIQVLPHSGQQQGAASEVAGKDSIYGLSDIHAQVNDELGDKVIDAEELQDGTRNAAAITRTWTKTTLRVVYTFLWLTYAVNAFQSSITGNLTAYITSGFELHSLIPTIAVVSNVMSAVAYMVLAKLVNVVDRTWGYLASAVLAVIGLVLSASCTDIYTYCASQCFYSVGFIGIIFCVDVITADTSSLKDRGLAYAFTSSPWIITAYAGPKISESFYESNWRWAFGCFAIIMPFVCLPLFFIMQNEKKKAALAGVLVQRDKSTRTWQQAVLFYLIEFDVLGVFLVSAGLTLFLLPFSIASDIGGSWASAEFLSMLILGIALLCAFWLYEKFWSTKPFVPWHLLTDRTVIGACGLDFSWQIAYYCWASYFSSYLQVVYGKSISQAGYIGSIYDVVATVWLLPTGYLIRKTGYFKWILYISVPLYVLGEGLMIEFRQPHWGIGWIVFTQILISFGGSGFTLIEQVAVLAAGTHNDAAAMLALLGMFGYIGGAVGNAISGAIWTNTLPAALQKYLPAETAESWADIYGDLDTQLSYPIGDPTRTAIIQAYSDAQTRMLIAGTAVMGLALFFIVLIKNIKVSEIEQVKGILF